MIQYKHLMAGSSYGLLNWKLRKCFYVGFLFLFFTAKRINNNFSPYNFTKQSVATRALWIFIWGIILSTGENMWVECRRAFLFSMANPSGLGSTKLPLTGKEQSAIKCHSCHGPAFGVGHDLYISTNANTKSSTSYSYSWLGHSYQCPSGQQQRTFFTGATSFLVTDYEVFSLNKWRQSWNWIIQVKLH